MQQNIYQFKVRKIDGEEVNLSSYNGKVLLIVNTASACGFTPQLKELQELRDQMGSKFEVLGFPSNDFGKQEPLENTEIGAFCEKNFGVQFPVFEKIMVRGTHAHPLFKFLSEKKQNGNVSSTPRWNFHKYLVNQKGEVVDYFYPFTKPNSSKVRKKIQKLLSGDK